MATESQPVAEVVAKNEVVEAEAVPAADNNGNKTAESTDVVVKEEQKTVSESGVKVDESASLETVKTDESVDEKNESTTEEKKEKPATEEKKKVEVDPNDFTFRDWPENDYFKVSVVELPSDILRCIIHEDKEKGIVRFNMTQFEALKNAHFTEKTDRCGARALTWRTEELPEKSSRKLAIPAFWEENQNILINNFNPEKAAEFEKQAKETIEDRKAKAQERKEKKLRSIAIANGEQVGPAPKSVNLRKRRRNQNQNQKAGAAASIAPAAGNNKNANNRAVGGDRPKGSAGRAINVPQSTPVGRKPQGGRNDAQRGGGGSNQRNGGGGGSNQRNGGGGGGSIQRNGGGHQQHNVPPFARPPSLFATNIQQPTPVLNTHAFGIGGGNGPANNGRKRKSQQPSGNNIMKRGRAPQDPYENASFGYDNIRRNVEPFGQNGGGFFGGPGQQQQHLGYDQQFGQPQMQQQQRWNSMPSGLDQQRTPYASFPTPVPPPAQQYQSDYGRPMGYQSRF